MEDETLVQLRAVVAAESRDGSRLAEHLDDNPICTVRVDESVPCIALTWRSYATATQLRFIHEAMLDLIRSRGLTLILGDDTELPSIHTEDQRWIVENWIPRAQAAGMRAAATKAPRGYFGRYAIRQIGPHIPWELRVFDTLPEARRWLQTISAR